MHSLYSKIALTLSTASASAVLAPSGIDQASQQSAATPVIEAATNVLGKHAVVVKKSTDGLFYLSAKVNGVPVRFLVDTGANMTVLPSDIARSVNVVPSDGALSMATVGGNAIVEMARVGTLVLAGRKLENLKAAVSSVPGHPPILGIDALSRIGTVVIDRNNLTIHS